jgi:transposase
VVQGEESLLGRFRYPEGFGADAVVLVRSSGKPIAQVAEELGVDDETLRAWVRAAEAGERPGAAAESAKDAELARLRNQVAELRLEREILREAAAYFARETLG